MAELTTLEINANRADPEDQCILDIKAALAVHGHEDALDEYINNTINYAASIHVKYSCTDTASIAIGMKPWYTPQISEH